jgi:hypothetical protein
MIANFPRKIGRRSRDNDSIHKQLYVFTKTFALIPCTQFLGSCFTSHIVDQKEICPFGQSSCSNRSQSSTIPVKKFEVNQGQGCEKQPKRAGWIWILCLKLNTATCRCSLPKDSDPSAVHEKICFEYPISRLEAPCQAFEIV